jgi:serine protease Do
MKQLKTLSVWLTGLLLIQMAFFTHAAGVSLPDFTSLVEKYSPAVVNISTKQTVTIAGPQDFKIPGLPDDHQFGEFFRKFLEQYQLPYDGPDSFDEQAMGSGVIVSADGYILTNAHVVMDADEILVKLYDRREMEAKVIGTDDQTDIALLKIEANNLPTVKLGSSKDLKVGEWVMAIGNPFGFDHTVTAGIVSAKGRNFMNENYVPFIQTDVAINPGNSGGPLFNTRGEVVGINSRISSEPGRKSYAGLSFAIPAEVAKDVMHQLKAHGQVSRGWLGVLIQDVTPDLSQTFGLDKPRGALVAKVIDDSPAEAGGVEVGDIILQFNGQRIAKSSALPPMVGSLRAGQQVELGIMREGRTKTLRFKTGELPEQALTAGNLVKPRDKSTRIERLGIRLRELTDEDKKETGADFGVVVTEVTGMPAEEIGLRKDDIIQMVDNRKIERIDDLEQLVKGLRAGRSVAILVYRQSGPVFLALRIP